MISFRFRFASILQFQRHQRDEVRMKLAQLMAEQSSTQSQLTSVRNERTRLFQNTTLEPTGPVTIVKLRLIDRHDGQLQRTERKLRLRYDSLSEQVAQCQADLQQAQQEVQRLEKLETADRAAYQRQSNRTAQRVFDEQAAMSHQRQRG